MAASIYRVPRTILSHSKPLQTHVTLEPLPEFASMRNTPSTCSGEAKEHFEFLDYREETSTSKKPGRKITSLNATLRLFTRCHPTHSHQPPKLENIRYRIMRTLKKTLRRVYEKKGIKRKGLMDFDVDLEVSCGKLREFKEYARENREELEPFSQLVNGPKVDQSRRPQKPSFSTYNNSYLEHVFQNPTIRRIYGLFITLIYSNDQVQSLMKRFEMKCCEKKEHFEGCGEKWKAFREVLDGYLGTKVERVDV